MWRTAEEADGATRVRKLVSSAFALSIAALAVAALGAHAPLAGQEEPSLRDGLGNHHFDLSTDVEAARTWFDQGFRLTYAFEHAEAVEAFRRATERDPDCAMCWWGVAWASGPNINAGMDSAGAGAAREAILAEPAPPDDLLYPTGTWRYARAMACVRTGRLDRAVEELERLRAVQSEPTLEEERVWDLNATAALLGVAVEIVEGELAAARGDHDEAVSILEDGLRRESDLVYDEPPPWHLPVRHVLGAVLLEAGRAAEAEAVYRRALERFPENGYALKGLVQSLESQGRADEAEAARERFRAAWRSADV